MAETASNSASKPPKIVTPTPKKIKAIKAAKAAGRGKRSI